MVVNIDFEEIKPMIKELAERHKLLAVALFGSQATGALHSKSDIDIAILGRDQIAFGEKIKISSALSDVFKREDVEVVDIDPNSASPTLMYAVVRDGKLLYERSVGDFLRWKLYAIKMWMETAWLRALRDKKLIEWAEKNSPLVKV